MRCPEPEALVRHLECETTGPEAEPLRTHLESCESCRRVVSEIAALENCLERLPPPPEPEQVRGCLAPNLLAAFSEGRLPEAVRAAAEQHLSRCGRCLDELVGSAGHVEALEAGARATPRPVLEQALAIGEPPARSRWMSWPALAAAAMLVVALSLVHGPSQRPPDGPGPMPLAPAPDARDPIPGFARRQLGSHPDVVAGGILPLSRELARLVSDCAGDPSGPPRTRLLSALRAGPLEIPVERVKTVTLDPRLVAAIESGSAPPEVQVTLYRGGKLLIGEGL
jgi:hypothetical protein